jgi:meso-butanediol dehydrogenase/(S,S)-butanediol dehydrogenase/diacetyl reductase
VSQQRNAIVTGVASGIGAATARRLAEAGWRVIGIDRRPGTDVTGDAAEPAVLHDAMRRLRGPLDGLVCSAGLPPSGPWDDLGHWDEVLRVNLKAAFCAFRELRPALTAGTSSSVVFVGSVVGSGEGSLRSPAYAAAKAGLEGLARSLSLIGAPDGIRVNVVAAGAIDTPFDEKLAPAADRPDVPLGRMGTADEVASVCQFLLGPDAAYVTGSVWRVDGGRTALSNVDARRLRGD